MNTIVHRTALITDPQARAKVDIELAAAVFVLHPTDCEAIELALSTVSAVEYQGLPFDPVARRLWGVPITLTNAQTAGVAHTLASGAVGLNTDTQGVQIA